MYVHVYTQYVHVYKIYIHALTSCLNMEGRESRDSLIPLFLAGNLTPTIPLQYNSTRGLASLWAAVTLHQLMAVVAAMCTRWTCGCGSLFVASHAWVVCQLKRLVPGRRLLRRRGSCTELRLAGVARLIGPDGKWSVVVKLHRRVFMSVQYPNIY